MKLVIAEPETAMLRRAVRGWPLRMTSRIAAVELLRAVCRIDPRREPLARRVLAGVDLLAPSDRVLTTAIRLEPSSLGTLDAIHVASALRLRRLLEAFVSYDVRQLEAAEGLGLPVASPR